MILAVTRSQIARRDHCRELNLGQYLEYAEACGNPVDEIVPILNDDATRRS
jgi:hypothetical protein